MAGRKEFESVDAASEVSKTGDASPPEAPRYPRPFLYFKEIKTEVVVDPQDGYSRTQERYSKPKERRDVYLDTLVRSGSFGEDERFMLLPRPDGDGDLIFFDVPEDTVMKEDKFEFEVPVHVVSGVPIPEEGSDLVFDVNAIQQTPRAGTLKNMNIFFTHYPSGQPDHLKSGIAVVLGRDLKPPNNIQFDGNPS